MASATIHIHHLSGPLLAYWCALSEGRKPTLHMQAGRLVCLVRGAAYYPWNDLKLIDNLIKLYHISPTWCDDLHQWVALHPRDKWQIGGQSPCWRSAVIKALLVVKYGETYECPASITAEAA